MTIWIYKFDDGTTLKLFDNGLSTEELWALKPIHGKVETEVVTTL